MIKIAFIQKEAYEKISVHYLAGACRTAGFDYQIFIYDLEDDFWAELVKYDPKYVIYSLFIEEDMWAFDCLKQVKNLLPRVKTLVGGSFTLIFPEICRKWEVDFVFRSDGEYTLPDFIRKMETKESVENIPGICYINSNGIEYRNDTLKLVNIRDVPMPDRDLYYKYISLRNCSRKIFIAARGCPYKCTFCYNSEFTRFFEEKYWRQRNVKDVIEEIQYVREKYGLKWVHFQDGTFNADKKWLFSFLTAYIKADLPQFLCNARPEPIDEDIIILLKKAGCDRITFGIQSGNSRIRREVAGRPSTNEQIIEACHLCKKHGLRTSVDIMFGWPGETVKEALNTIRLCRILDAETYSSNVLVFYPGLRVTKYAYENNYIQKIPTLSEINSLDFNNSLLISPQKSMLVNMDKLSYYLIKFPMLECILLLLLRFPPNKLFLLLKNLHLLLRSLKYDNTPSKLRIISNYIKNSWKESPSSNW